MVITGATSSKDELASVGTLNLQRLTAKRADVETVGHGTACAGRLLLDLPMALRTRQEKIYQKAAGV